MSLPDRRNANEHRLAQTLIFSATGRRQMDPEGLRHSDEGDSDPQGSPRFREKEKSIVW